MQTEIVNMTAEAIKGAPGKYISEFWLENGDKIHVMDSGVIIIDTAVSDAITP